MLEPGETEIDLQVRAYFAGVDRVLSDIALVLHYDLPPERRSTPLAEGSRAWAFLPPQVK